MAPIFLFAYHAVMADALHGSHGHIRSFVFRVVSLEQALSNQHIILLRDFLERRQSSLLDLLPPDVLLQKLLLLVPRSRAARGVAKDRDDLWATAQFIPLYYTLKKSRKEERRKKKATQQTCKHTDKNRVSLRHCLPLEARLD